MQKFRRFFHILVWPMALSVLAGVLGSGCLAVVAGGAAAGTIAYVKGDSQSVVDASVDTAALVASSVAMEKGLVSISEKNDDTAAILVFRNARDQKTTITIEAVTDSTSKIFVRQGVFGDEDESSFILNEIIRRL